MTSSDAREMTTWELIEILEKAAIGFRIRMETGMNVPGYDYSSTDAESAIYILMERGY